MFGVRLSKPLCMYGVALHATPVSLALKRQMHVYICICHCGVTVVVVQTRVRLIGLKSLEEK